MANNENLKKLSTSEARERGSKGGKASGKARRKKKELKMLLELALSQPAAKNRNEDNWTAITAALIKKALTGDTKAYEVIRDTLGQKPTEQQQLDLNAKIEVDYGDS